MSEITIETRNHGDSYVVHALKQTEYTEVSVCKVTVDADCSEAAMVMALNRAYEDMKTENSTTQPPYSNQ